MDFELKLGSVLYRCTRTQYNGDTGNCVVSADINGMKIQIVIPAEEKINRTKALVFIEAFHEGLVYARKDQNLADLKMGKVNV